MHQNALTILAQSLSLFTSLNMSLSKEEPVSCSRQWWLWPGEWKLGICGIIWLRLYRTSATNCARIYNDGLANNILTPSLPASFSKSLVLNVEDVWTALFLYWLLADCIEQGAMLQLEHNSPSQFTRLLPALKNCNARMVGPGQEEWNHACDLCCWVNTTPDGSQSKTCRLNVATINLLSQ